MWVCGRKPPLAARKMSQRSRLGAWGYAVCDTSAKRQGFRDKKVLSTPVFFEFSPKHRA